MIARLSAAAALTLLAVHPRSAAAQCVTTPSHLLAIEISGCRPAQIAIEEQVAGTRVWWLRPYMLSIADGNPGVVLRGRVERRRVFEQPQTLGPWIEDGEEAEFFYTSRDSRLCEVFEGVEEALLLSEPPCCEIIPPVSVACLLETVEARPVPQRVLERLEEMEDLEDAEDEDGDG